MKLKKIFALALCACMLFAVAPAALAEGGLVLNNGTGLTLDNSVPATSTGLTLGNSAPVTSPTENNTPVRSGSTRSGDSGVATIAEDDTPVGNDSFTNDASGTGTALTPVPSSLTAVSKTLGQPTNGVYPITLHAEAKSNVHTVTTAVDIVLVLDRSVAMRKGTDMTDMKTAATGFINTIKTQSPDSRIAIVSYAAEARIDSPFVKLRDDTTNSLTTAVNNLRVADEGTLSQPDNGLAAAVQVFQADSNENPNVVVFVTSGVPYDGKWPSTSITADRNAYKIAQRAIHLSKILKESGPVTLNLSEDAFYSDSSKCSASDFTGINMQGCDATVFCVGINLPSCNDSYEAFWSEIPGHLYGGCDGAKVNEYLYRVSSHRPDSSHVDGWSYSYTDGRTRDLSPVSYFRAGEGVDLSGFFSTISTQLGETVSDLTVRDYASPYFDFCDANGNVLTRGVSTDAKGTYVEWTGVVLNPGNAQGAGKVVFDQTIYVKPKAAFFGGNAVPTNIGGISGLYAKNTVLASFPEQPTVDVPINYSPVGLKDQTIYLSNAADLNELFASKNFSFGTNNDYVDITYTLKQGDNVVDSFTIDDSYATYMLAESRSATLADCTPYSVVCTVTPTKAGTVAAKNDYTPATATVHVVKPSVVGTDAHIKMGVEAPMAFTYDWSTKCACDTAEPASGVTPPAVTPVYSKTEANAYRAVCTDYTVTANVGGTLYQDIVDTFTIHVHAPTLTGSVYNVKLGSSTALESSDVTLDWVGTCITDGIAGTPDGDPAAAYTFDGTPTRENVTPLECTSYDVVLTKIGEVTPAANAYTTTILVHVATPEIEGADKTIYRGGEVAVGATIAGWEQCDCEGTIPNAVGTPTPEFAFSGGNVVSPDACAEFTAALTEIGSLDLEGTKYEGEITDTFKVHVLQPVITADDVTIHYGTSIDLDGNDNLSGVMSDVEWSDCCETVTDITGDEPTASYVFGVDGKDGYSPADCTELTAIWNLDGEDFTDTFTVHVLKPAFETTDITIYRGNNTNLNDRVAVEGEWTCDAAHTSKPAPVTNVPTITYAFEDSAAIAAPTQYAPIACESVVTTPTVGNKVWDELTAFDVHVLQPTFAVETQNVWANYTTEVALRDYGIASCELGWEDSTDGHNTPSTLPAGAPVASTVEYTFDKGENGTYVVGTSDDTITATKLTFALNNGYGAEYPLEEKTFVIHVNKFDLTINKSWNNVAEAYQQNCIFDVSSADPRGDFQVVVPKGQTSVVVSGLLCGVDYTITEDGSWSWRTTASEVTETNATHNHGITTSDPQCTGDSAAYNNELKEDIGTKWLSGEDCAINNAKTKNCVIPKKEEEVEA